MADYWFAGVSWSSLFATDSVGDGTRSNLVLNGGGAVHFAALKYGSKRANVGFAQYGTDVSNWWASSGSAVYTLPINGQSFSANNQSRGRAGIRFQMNPDGTYVVYRQASNSSSYVAITSGRWLPDGDAAGNYTCFFDARELGNSPVGSSVSSGVDNNAPGQVNLGGTTAYAEGWCSAIYTGTTIESHGVITMYLYRAGTLRSTTQISYWCNVNGN